MPRGQAGVARARLAPVGKAANGVQQRHDSYPHVVMWGPKLVLKNPRWSSYSDFFYYLYLLFI